MGLTEITHRFRQLIGNKDLPLPSEVIAQIETTTQPLQAAVHEERLQEVVYGYPNNFRQSRLFYRSVLELEREKDRLFKHIVPRAANDIEQIAGSLQGEWARAVHIAQQVQMIDRGSEIIDASAKGYFGIWQSLLEGHTLDSIPDRLKVRITAVDLRQAQDISQIIAVHRAIFSPYGSEPIRGSLTVKEPFTYMDVRTNMGLAEIQITTADSIPYTNLNSHK